MKDLIKIENTTIGGALVPTINARELYEFLGSQRQFSDWIKKRIEKLRLLENKDYILISQSCEIKNSRGGDRKSLHYAITLDVAKHIALMENTDRGFEVREYFIECEKKLQTHALPQTKIEAVRAYLQELEAHEATRIALTHKKEVAKLENGKSIYGASIRQVALKTGRNYSAKKLTRWCKANDRSALVIHPNGYSSAKVSVYHAEAWKEVYDIDLLKYFEEDELHWSAEEAPLEHH